MLINLLFAMKKPLQLVICDKDTAAECVRETVYPGDEIVIHWRHSVEKTIWEEKLLIEKNKTFTLIETKFQSFGAGVPNEKEGSVKVEDGFVIMGDLHETKPAYYWIHSQIAELTVLLNGKKLLLPEAIPHHHKVEMTIEKG